MPGFLRKPHITDYYLMHMMKMFLFDFDGVIADSLNFYENLVKRCLEQTGAPIIKTREEYLDLFDGNFYDSLRERGVDTTVFNNVAMTISTQMDYSSIVPFNDMLPVIRELARDNTLLVVSSNTSPPIKAFFSRYEYDGIFDDILGADFMLSKRKKIDHALGKWQVPRERTYYVGDTAGDIREGKEAGIKTVAATWGWHSRERLEKVNPDYIIENPGDLLRI